jgi:aminomethyltransferase
LVSADIAGLKRGQVRYALLLDETGGLLDDLMIGRPFAEAMQGTLQIVVNAGTKDADFALIAGAAGDRAHLERADDNALIAIQGPEAAAVVADILPEAAAMGFMSLRWLPYEGGGLAVTRSGYTGEDGYEVLVPRDLAAGFWARLLADVRVRPIGLGARDSLRLEAGLPLYGHDLDATVSPIEAGLGFALSKRRRKRADFTGAARILAELEQGPRRIRVGLRVLEGAPAREGAEIADAAGTVVGRVTSGGFSPSLGFPIAMGFVPPAHAAPGAALNVIVRGKAQPAQVVPLPFVSHRYVRQT